MPILEEIVKPQISSGNRKLEVAKEVFVMKYEENYLIYAPLSQKVSVVDENVFQKLKSWIENPQGVTSEETDNLKDIGLLVENEQLPLNEYGPFTPTALTLFPTSDCNLRCVYCYGEAGRVKKDLKPKVAKAGIDFIIKNAIKTNTNGVMLGFHGGGEPTVKWKFVVDSENYFRNKSSSHNLKSNVSLVTNGILSKNKLRWIIKNIDSVQLSFDGPKDIHDEQRPFSSGKGSFDKVYKTAKAFSEKSYNFGIRATITQKSVNRLHELYDFFVSEFNPKYVHFEPLYECGRCSTTLWAAPSHEDYANNFLQLYKRLLREEDSKLTTTRGNIDKLSSRFCGAAGSNFCITPESFVTSCFEVSLSSDPRSKTFFYGYFDENQDQFVFDDNKRLYLHERQTQNLEHCSDCFIKWNCAGDCSVKIRGDDIYDTSCNGECGLNQSIAKELLIEKIVGGNKK